jgi:hypothetical protein
MILHRVHGGRREHRVEEELVPFSQGARFGDWLGSVSVDGKE